MLNLKITLIGIFLLLAALSRNIANAQVPEGKRGSGGGGTYMACGSPVVKFSKNLKDIKGYKDFLKIMQELGKTATYITTKLEEVKNRSWFVIPCGKISKADNSPLPFSVTRPIIFFKGLVFVMEDQKMEPEDKPLAILNEAARSLCYRPHQSNGQSEEDVCTLKMVAGVIQYLLGNLSRYGFENTWPSRLQDINTKSSDHRLFIKKSIKKWKDYALKTEQIIHKAKDFCQAKLDISEFGIFVWDNIDREGFSGPHRLLSTEFADLVQVPDASKGLQKFTSALKVQCDEIESKANIIIDDLEGLRNLINVQWFTINGSFDIWKFYGYYYKRKYPPSD